MAELSPGNQRALVEALRLALHGGQARPSEPRSVTGALRYFDGNRSQLARAMLGLGEGGRLPAKGSPERRRYDATMQQLRRADPSTAQGRAQPRPAKELGEKAAQAARPRWAAKVRSWAGVESAMVARARRSGLYMRLVVSGFTPAGRVNRAAKAKKPTSSYHRKRRTVMPSDMGAQRRVFIRPALVGPVMDAWAGGELDQAADRLIEAFFESYQLPGTSIDDVESAQVEVAQ